MLYGWRFLRTCREVNDLFMSLLIFGCLLHRMEDGGGQGAQGRIFLLAPFEDLVPGHHW